MPLALWPCAQSSETEQRSRRYLPSRDLVSELMPPELAHRILLAYSSAGDLVVDPRCGSGTVLIEAAVLGRIATGLDSRAAAVQAARANRNFGLPPEARSAVEILVGAAPRLSEVVPDLLGAVDLIVLTPPALADVAAAPPTINAQGHPEPPAPQCKAEAEAEVTAEAEVPDCAADAAARAWCDWSSATFAGCWQLLRPGGLLVTVTCNTPQGGQLIDLAGHSVAVAQHVGFGYLQHVIALLGPVTGGAIHPPGYLSVAPDGTHDRSACRPVHADVCVFTKPAAGLPATGRSHVRPGGAEAAHAA